MSDAYHGVLRRHDVLSALIPYVLARLPLSMAPLSLLLLMHQRNGSYHQAGVVCGAYAIAMAVSSPILGRLVDRYGQSWVLVVTGILHASAMSSAALAGEKDRFGLVAVSAMAAGATLPPVTACMRVLWTRLLPDEDGRRAGFAIDGVIVEVAELSGPLLVSLLLLFGRPATAVAVSGVLMGAATVAFRFSPASRSVPGGNARRSTWGALAISGVRRLLVVVACSTATIGAIEVAMTAFARQHGGISLSGVYIGIISLGGILAGLFFGGSGRLGVWHPATVLTAALGVSAAAAADMAEAPGPWAMCAMLFVFGAAVAVGVIVQLATMSEIVTDDVRTEAFTWGATANFVGLGVGTAVSGWTLDQYGLDVTFVVAACPTIVTVVVTMLSRSVFAATARHDAVADQGAPAVVDMAVEAMTEPEVAIRAPEAAELPGQIAELRVQIAELEAALAAAQDRPANIIGDAQDRARRMLDRADAACLELRERASDDADRVRAAATAASLEIMASANRDARAILERARREAEAITSRARQVAEGVPTGRVVLHAVPGLDPQGGHASVPGQRADGDGVAATS